MKLVLIVGNGAVGKMTVGQELMKLTGLRLFHNHMTIEPVLEIFGTFHTDAILQMREVIFREFAKSDNYGMIHTIMWAFDMQQDWDYINHVVDIFQEHNAEIYCVELVAPQEIRLQRNETPNRLAHKASKRDITGSRERVIAMDEKFRLESNPGEIPFENYMRIDNSNLEPDVVAAMIKERFAL
ncbi:MAG: AAA family ATPase [Oscillospiraceae bacterium]|nr:AAA family ATPase [Oscillospiraceae bacterium]